MVFIRLPATTNYLEDDVTSFQTKHIQSKETSEINQSGTSFEEIVQSAEDEFLATAFSNIFVKMEAVHDVPRYEGQLSVVLELDIGKAAL